MKTHSRWIGFIVFLCVCAFAATALAVDAGVRITTPSEGEFVIAQGRSFYVMGTLAEGDYLKDGDELRVELRDASGTLHRSISTTIKDNPNMYIDYPRLSYYGKNKEELRSAGMPDLIWDGKDKASFRNGDAKLYYNNTEFAALIPGGDGALLDGLRLVDKNGKPYELLPEGKYTIDVFVTDKTDPHRDAGDVSGHAQKNIEIGANEDKLLSRFSPAQHNQRITEFANENQLRVYTDLFPGYWSKGDIFCETLPEWRAADGIEYTEGKAHFVIYNVKPSSATYAVEAAMLQKTGAVDDESRLQCYYYQYGEPVLPDEALSRSEIVAFPAGDKLQLVRAEIGGAEAADNVYRQDEPSAEAYDLCVADGVKAGVGQTVSVYGVTALIQIEPRDLRSHGDNSYSLNNRISTVRYTLRADGFERDYKKKVALNRISGGWDNHSELEFKHDFSITPDMAGRTILVEAAGYDAHGALVDGTQESFALTVGAAQANGAITNAEAPLVPNTSGWGIYALCGWSLTGLALCAAPMTLWRRKRANAA